jgi:hypothetical protein
MTDTDLATRLQRLEDLRAIEVLKAQYLRACDRKQPAAVRACFADDAVIDYEGFPLFTDPGAFTQVYTDWGCRPNVVDMHHLQNPIVELTGPDSAQGWFDLFFFQIDIETRRHTQMAVSYDDSFVRIDGAWKIARTTARRLSMLVRSLEADGVERVLVAGRSDQPETVPERLA